MNHQLLGITTKSSTWATYSPLQPQTLHHNEQSSITSQNIAYQNIMHQKDIDRQYIEHQRDFQLQEGILLILRMSPSYNSEPLYNHALTRNLNLEANVGFSH